MGFTTKSRKSSGSSCSFVPVPVGMHLARCYRIIDLGTQEKEWQGNKKNIPQVMLQFEIHGEDDAGQPILTSAGKPMSMSKTYTNILSEKSNLRLDLCSWRGKDFTRAEELGFELSNVIGVWAMITAATSTKDGKEYTNIVSINPVPSIIKQAGLPEGINKTQIFWIEEPDMEMYESFSEFTRAKIALSPEWQARSAPVKQPTSAPVINPSSPFDEFESDLPF